MLSMALTMIIWMPIFADEEDKELFWKGGQTFLFMTAPVHLQTVERKQKVEFENFLKTKNKSLLRTNFLFTTRSCTTTLSTLMIMTTMMTMV